MTSLAQRLSDEADLCRNDGANDIAGLLDEAVAQLRADPLPMSCDRAADMLTAYAELVKATGAYAEQHYVPEVEFVITELRARRPALSPLPAGWRIDRSSCLDGDECFVISGDPMACGEYVYRSSQPVVFAFLSALATDETERSHAGREAMTDGPLPHEWDDDACCIHCGYDGAEAAHLVKHCGYEKTDADRYCEQRPAASMTTDIEFPF